MYFCMILVKNWLTNPFLPQEMLKKAFLAFAKIAFGHLTPIKWPLNGTNSRQTALMAHVFLHDFSQKLLNKSIFTSGNTTK